MEESSSFHKSKSRVSMRSSPCVPGLMGDREPERPDGRQHRSWVILLMSDQLSPLAKETVIQFLSHVSFGTPKDCSPWTVAHHGQAYWSGLLFPSPGDPPTPGIEPMSPALAGGFFTIEPLGKPSQAERIMLRSAIKP